MRPYFTLILSLFLVVSACSDDDNNNNIVVSNNKTDMGQADVSKSDTPNDMTDMALTTDADMGASDMEDTSEDVKTDVPSMCKTDDCAAGEDCVDNACKIVNSCEAVKNLGELVAGTPVNEKGSFLESGSDNISGSCGMGVERIFSFSLTKRSRVDFEAKWLGQFDGAVSFRSTCVDDGSEISCSDMEVGFRILEPGTYFIILEVRLGNPDKFELDLSATELACVPGEGVCAGDELSYCTVNQPTLYACADTCSLGACDGDQCDAPVVIPAKGGAFSGATFDYENSYNFQNSPTCPLNTDGYDVVYSLGTLAAGNFVNVKSSPFESVFIMKGMNSCGDTSGCVAMFDGNSDIDYVIPPMEGDEYFVIIDTKIGVQSNAFNHEVNIPNR